VRRRERLFWICVGAALIVLFLSIIPSHYEICDEAEKTKGEHCPSYQVAQFLWIKIPQFLDVHNWLITALFAGLVTLFTWRLWQATNELRVSTDKLWRAGESQMELIKANAAEQSRDMNASVAAAAEANRISSEGFHASQRAWVTEETVIDSDLVWNKQGCEFVIKTKVKNIGIAPAQEVVIDAKIVAAIRRRPEYNISDAMNELPSGTVGHLLFPSADFAPNKRLKLTREQIDKVAASKEVTINVIVIVRYLSTMDRKSARTIRFYDLKRIPVIGENEVSYPLPISVNEDVPKGMLLLTHHWMPSYAD
jgi:hypothetical protein